MNSLLPFLPPLVVFIFGLFTHRIILSLFLGLLTAAFSATGGSLTDSALLICQSFLNNCEMSQWTSWNSFLFTNKLFVVGFIFCAGILFHMMQRSHGVEAIAQLSQRKIKSAKSAETASLLISHSLFIDGCLSSITTSSIIRPIADRLNVPRVKTALLADSMSGPLVVICPISCFAALLIALMHNNGVQPIVKEGTLLQANPNVVYWLALPFSLYSLTIVATFWTVVRARLSLGEMRVHEKNSSADFVQDSKALPSHKVWNFFIPTILLPLSVFFFIALTDPGGHNFLEMVTEAPISFVLFAASLTTMIVSMGFYYAQGDFTLLEIKRLSFESIRAGLPSVAIIVLAWTLADILRSELNLGEEISQLLSQSIPLWLLPLVFFWVTGIVSGSLGSSWGTIAIFIPLVAPIVIHTHGLEPPVTLEQVPLLLPCFGAAVSGAAFGDHVSLLSDSTVLSSAGALCHPIEHVKTQIPYALPVFIGSSVGFLAAGFFGAGPYGFTVIFPVIISVALSLLLAFSFHIRGKKRASNI